jgi:hypothetical protein
VYHRAGPKSREGSEVIGRHRLVEAFLHILLPGYSAVLCRKGSEGCGEQPRRRQTAPERFQMGFIYVNPERPNSNPDPVAGGQRYPRDIRPHGDE